MNLPIDQALAQAIEAHKAGNLQDAERLYRVILDVQPQHTEANHNLGVLAVALGQPNEALPYLKAALEANRSQGQFWVSYINALIEAKQIAEARKIMEEGKHQGLPETLIEGLERCLGKLLSDAPSQEEIKELLASYNAGNYQQAEQQARNLTRTYPNHPFGWKVIGTILRFNGKLEESLEAIQESVRINPMDAEVRSYLGFTHQELGQLREAETSYREAICIRPEFAEAFNNLGAVFKNLGSLKEAEVSFLKAIRLRPNYAEPHSNLGSVLADLGRPEKAVASFREAIRLKPNNAEAHSNLGKALKDLGRLTDAEASCREAIRLSPDFAEAHGSIGNTFMVLGRLNEAEASYREAIRLKPNYAEAHSNLGNALHDQGRIADAEVSYREAIRITPEFFKAHSNLGNALRELGRITDAEASCREAIRLKPNYAEAHNNLGNALKDLGRLTDAEASYHEAIRLSPNFAEAHNNLGITLQELGRFPEAEASYCEAIRLKPDLAEAHWNYSLLILLRGEYNKGWELFEWRIKQKKMKHNFYSFPQPSWRGQEAIQGRRMLIHAEQGLGDVVQFCRYVPMVKALGAEIILEVPKPLVSLVSTLNCPMTIVPQGTVLPEFDTYCPIMSLPLAFKTSVETIPSEIPYLFSDPVKRQYWKEKLGTPRGLRVGLVWSGGFRPNQPELWSVNERRNIPLQELVPLNVPGIEFFSLQKGAEAVQQLRECEASGWEGPNIADYTEELNDFSDTAALIDNLDLIISVDTSTAHVAAAMGKPVWLLNRFDTCWRWLLVRNDSPWYPTVRLFRQPAYSDWQSVILEVAEQLKLSHPPAS